MFLNREEAGIRLSLKLSQERTLKDPVIVAIPRGGIILGNIISQILKLPLMVLVVKKIGSPSNPELAIGAAGPDGTVFWDEELIDILGVSEEDKKIALDKTVKTIKEREKNLGIKILDLSGREALIVDDGVATGATAIAASQIVKKLGAGKVILVTPVISKRTKQELGQYFDKIISILTPRDFQAVGQFYRQFPQVEDEEVKKILGRI